MHVLIVLIPLLPLAGFVVTLLFGRGLRPPARARLAGRGDGLVGARMFVVVHVLGAHTRTIVCNLFTWISSGSFHVSGATWSTR